MKQLAEGDFGKHISIAGHFAYPGYVIKGGKINLMIDAGINMMGPLYLKTLARILGGADRLDWAFATHSHYDHLGAIPYLKRKIHGLKVGGAARIAELLRKDSALDLMRRLSEIQRDIFLEIVGDQDVRLEPIELDFSLKQGDVLDLGEVHCQVHEVPGHTRDSLAYFIPELGALFAGEAVGIPGDIEGKEVHSEFASSYHDYLKSLEKMMALRPRLIGMAHAWVFTDTDAAEFLENAYRATLENRELIESYLDKAQGEIERAVELIARKEYDEKGNLIQERNAYLANLKAKVAHIASLRKGQ